MDIGLLKKLGFSDKSAKIYLALLQLGPSSVRSIAEFCELNRGTTYDALNWLKNEGIVNYYHKDTKQHFVAEDPEKLHKMVRERQENLQSIDRKLDKFIPELSALHHKGGNRPVARYFSRRELSHILQDVLDICEHSEDAMYRIYSTEGVREFLYENFPTFSDVRVAKGVSVKVIALGEGGELRGLDERKWIQVSEIKPTYIIIYPGKTAYISLDAKGDPIGVVIENDGVSNMQKFLFDRMWDRL